MLRSSVFLAVANCFRTLSSVVFDVVRLVFLVARSHSTLAAENLFLRKQLALFQERKAKPRRADDSTRWMMATLSRMFPWREALLNPLQTLHHCPWRRSFTAVVSRSRYHRRDGVLEAQSRQAVSWSREDGT